MGNSPCPVGGKLTWNHVEITFQVAFHCLLVFVVEAAAGQINQLTGQSYRILMLFNQPLHDHSLFLGVEPEYLNTFFAMSNCMVSRPTIRSNSAIRSWS